MVRIKKEDKKYIDSVHARRMELANDITERVKQGKNKSTKDLKELIALCKDLEVQTNILIDYGYKATVWRKFLNYRTWEAVLNGLSKTKKTTNKSTNISIDKKPIKKSENVETENYKSLYYIMLCWTANPDFFVCDTIVNTIRLYFEKLKLEFMDTSKDEFPDRTEFVSTYKIKTTQEVYNTIMNSAEFIIDNNTTSIHEKCNVGVFGKKIE